MAREDFRSDPYDLNEVYAGGAKDRDGHSSNIRCHIPDPWVAVIMEFVQSPDWPEYKTAQDFYRDAIYHRMKWAATQPDRQASDRVRALMALSQGRAALDYATMVHEEAYRFVEQARQTMTQLLSGRNNLSARETVKELEASLDALPEPFRSQLAGDIQSWEHRINQL